MTWMLTASGAEVSLLKPDPATIRLGDIAYHLARINRFLGATVFPWNVAVHSGLVVRLLPEKTDVQTKMYAHLHDAPEYLIGDRNFPMKVAMREINREKVHDAGTVHVDTDNFAEIEGRIRRAIHTRMGLPPEPSDHQRQVIATADHLALAIERAQLLPPSKPWDGLPALPENPPTLKPVCIADSERQFIGIWDSLMAESHVLRPNASVGH